MSDRIGGWMQTFLSKQFWPLDPRADEVFIEDIAHALSNQCRFAGHCQKFYSVAEHSVRVSLIVPPEYALHGLLHDASEAYLVDLPRPVKYYSEIGKHYVAAEKRVAEEIGKHFGLVLTPEPAQVKEADNILLMTEARDLLGKPPVPWQESAVKPLPDRIEPWSPTLAKDRFIARFAELR